MDLFRYCIAASAVLLIGPAAATPGRAGQNAPAAGVPAPVAAAAAAPRQTQIAVAPVEGESEFTLFLGGRRVGVERARVARAGSSWVISSTATFGAPLNIILNRFELKYTADWQPTDLHIEASQPGRTLAITTTFGVTTATNVITQNSATTSRTDQISARTIILPNNFYAGYIALAARLAAAAPGTELPVYVVPSSEIKVRVKAVTEEQLASASGPLAIRLYKLTFENPAGPLEGELAIDARGRLVRVEVASAGLRLIRSDLAGIGTRPQPIRNQTDTDVVIPDAGFNLSGTLTTPPGVGRLRYLAVVLVGGSGPVERDEEVAGIPIFAQLAGSLAAQGFIVLRYDKRGIGQSGGRSERATLQDYADDLSAALKWMDRRQDVEPGHIAVVGHSEGGAVAMLAAARDKRVARLVLIATPGKPGSALILDQQRHALDLLKTPEPERQTKIDLQQRIQAAVVAEKGWEGIPPELRAQADTAWFRSFLMFDPAKTMAKIRQPILILQGDLDTQVTPANADALAELARGRKKGGPVELRHLAGINHLLVPAESGEVSEYEDLKDKKVAAAVATAIADWLKK